MRQYHNDQLLAWENTDSQNLNYGFYFHTIIELKEKSSYHKLGIIFRRDNKEFVVVSMKCKWSANISFVFIAVIR